MEKIKLEEIAPIKQGQTIESNDNVWLLNLDMVESNTGRILDYIIIPKKDIGNSTIIFDSSNVLYSKLRPYLNKVVLPMKSGYATSEMLPLKPDTKRITREYLTYFLRSKNFVEYINSKTSGAKMPRANTQDLKNALVPCPSINEQLKITSIFDAITKIIDLRKLQLEELDTLIKSRFVEMFGKVNDKIILKKLCDVSGGYSFKSTDIIDEGIKLLQISNVALNQINWDVKKYLPLEFEDKYSNFLIEKDDIVMALTRPIIQSLGNVKTCIVHDSDLPCLLNQRVGKIKVKDINKTKAQFIYHCFMTEEFTRYVESSCTGCSQPNISTKDIESYGIPNVSIEQQDKFVTFVQHTDKLKAEVQKSLDETEILFNSLLQKYFE